ncbi:VWA domain-containing protein [Persicobacter psychrovividus]|uniref:Transporter n=1 Tax=Persicobacter psychrovividus TaxID=387638 RepID=A0ABM7VLS2_9BACT|nr:transporter [Persicobacter psychrovividus]
MNNLQLLSHQLHFIRPEALWLLIPVLLFPMLYLIKSEKNDHWLKYIAPHLRMYVTDAGNLRGLFGARILLILGWVVAVLSLSGPSFQQVDKPGAKIETTCLILLQVNNSMLNNDLEPNRLERAKYKIKDLLHADPGVRIGLIAYAGSAHLLMPPTIDYQTLSIHLESLHPSIMPSEGNNLTEAMQLATQLSHKNQAPVHYLLMTDHLEDELVLHLQGFMKNRKDQLTIMPIRRADGHLQQQAKKLQDAKNIQVQIPTLDHSDVEQLAKALKVQKTYQLDDQQLEATWVEHGYYLMWAITFFTLLWFRKGFTPLMVVCFSLTACDAEPHMQDLLFSRDYQGQQAFDQGQYHTAAALFDKPLHKGVAYFRAGAYKEAITAFAADSSASGYYNMGVSYLRNHNFNAAYNAFCQSHLMDSTYAGNRGALQKIQQWFIAQNLELSQLSDTTEVPLFEKMKQNNNAEEDLSGGGQEATDAQMQEERLAEEAESEVHAAEENDEFLEDSTQEEHIDARMIMIRDVQEDPRQFLKRKFEYQLKRAHATSH